MQFVCFVSFVVKTYLNERWISNLLSNRQKMIFQLFKVKIIIIIQRQIQSGSQAVHERRTETNEHLEKVFIHLQGNAFL